MFVPRLLLVTFVCVVLTPHAVLAEWLNDGTPVNLELSLQSAAVACSDGAGGLIVAWHDYRNDLGDIYAQRIDAAGTLKWTASGVVICNQIDAQAAPTIISDGAGGAIITWLDQRNMMTNGSDIYAQRINSLGITQWTANGAPVCQVNQDQSFPLVVSDNAGGVIIVWRDVRAGNDDIYAQRLNGAGSSQWTLNGVGVCTHSSIQQLPYAAADGTGGLLVTWQDLRNAGNSYDVYANRLNSSGAALWGTDGVGVISIVDLQGDPKLAPDGTGGAIIAWEDYRNGNSDIYAQHMTAAGAPTWFSSGLPIGLSICQTTGEQLDPVVAPDGNGGAFIAWDDRRAPPYSDLYVQRVSGSGATPWTYNGRAVCQAPDFQYGPVIVADGAGGMFIGWSDVRSGNRDVYVQRLNLLGQPHWQSGGVVVTAAEGDQTGPSMIPDGVGGLLFAWGDNRSVSTDVYAQHIDGLYGYWGHPEPSLYAVKDVPADQGGKVRLEWYASGRDVRNQQVISHYTIWRAIDQAAFASAAANGTPTVALSNISPDYVGKAIRREKAQAVDYFWELVGNQDATYRRAYAFTASTSHDSTAAGAATHQFQVVSHASDSQYINWPSNILSGRSVDNLAPPAPLYLAALRVGADVHLQWNRVRVPDLDDYRVYRATLTGVTPIPPNFLANDDDTVMVDASAPTSALYYIVTAKDVHGNEGVASNEATVNALTGVGNLPPITSLTVLQNYPNPFTNETELMVGLPAKSDIRVEIYDVAGRRVREASLANQASGWRRVRIDSRDDRGAVLSSGVYFYRVHAGSATVTRKMVIAR